MRGLGHTRAWQWEAAGLVVNYASLERPAEPFEGSLTERVAAELKAAIRAGRIHPGMRLVEGRLARDFGVSRVPVREAIRLLAAEGLVTVSARRSAQVSAASDREVREAIEVRALLEGHNARLAARRQDKAAMRRMRALLARGERAAAEEQAGELSGLNVRYHEETLAASGNALLREMLERLRDRTAALFAPEAAGRQAALWADHAEILRAIVAGDEGQAAALAAGHVGRAAPGAGSSSGEGGG